MTLKNSVFVWLARQLHRAGWWLIENCDKPALSGEWVTASGLDDYLNIKGYFVCGDIEENNSLLETKIEGEKEDE